MPRWPLAVIALPAAAAVWSGWVGLGGMCGFGLVHPLPGIIDGFTINTAITLPIGVEAYGAYALAAWLHPRTPATARTFARRSALGALGLGMLGQVAYHLLSAAHATRAPWPVVMVVSCLPVLVLGMGTGLVHLLREPAVVITPERETSEQTVADVPGSVPEDAPVAVPVIARVDVPASAVPTVPGPVRRTVAAGRPRTRAAKHRSRTPERVFADELGRGEIPSLRSVKARMNVGSDRARVILADLRTVLDARTPERVTVDA